jgi:hypothetical protein
LRQADRLAQFLCSSQGPFLRPGLQNAVKAGRRAWLAAGSGVARLRLDRAEHGARIKRVGRLHRQSFVSSKACPLASTAQAMRASLLASAIASTLARHGHQAQACLILTGQCFDLAG